MKLGSVFLAAFCTLFSNLASADTYPLKAGESSVVCATGSNAGYTASLINNMLYNGGIRVEIWNGSTQMDGLIVSPFKASAPSVTTDSQNRTTICVTVTKE
jgi:hypothetical protein